MLLSLQSVRRQFDGSGGITNVSMHVPDGAVYVLAGPNGAGKTTTLSIITGLLFAEAGALVLAGAPVPLDRAAPRPGIGLVADDPILDGGLTPWQWLGFAAAVKDVRPDDPTAAAHRLLLQDADLDKPIRALSFGTRRKVALWTELLTTSSLLVLDEPMIGLDPDAIRAFSAELRAFADTGRSVILSTHLLREAESVATHVGIIRDGRTVSEGTLDEVRSGRTLAEAYHGTEV